MYERIRPSKSKQWSQTIFGDSWLGHISSCSAFQLPNKSLRRILIGRVWLHLFQRAPWFQTFILVISNNLFFWSINNQLIRHSRPLKQQGQEFMRADFFWGRLVPNKNQLQKIPHIYFLFLTAFLKSVYLQKHCRSIDCTKVSNCLFRAASSEMGESMRFWLPVVSYV